MVITMTNNEENDEKTRQLGAYLPIELVLRFREQAESRKFKKKEILEQFARWWLSLDIEKQRQFYHQTFSDEYDSDLYGPNETYLDPEKKAFRREVLKILAETGLIAKQAKQRPRKARRSKSG